MKTDLECIPCVLKQAINTIQLCRLDREIGKKVIRKVLEELERVDYNKSPAFYSDIAYHIFSRLTGIDDPYYDIKIEYNKAAMKLYPRLKEMVGSAEDSLYEAAKVAIAGNVIDFGVHLKNGEVLELKDVIEEIKKIPLARDYYPLFARDLTDAKKILYIADNAGEIVFDKLFINQIIKAGKSVVLTVKSGPIINDATIEDTKQVGLEGLLKIIETGNNCIGINFNLASREFLKEFESADIIISKGQGNFESLDEVRGKKLFFLLKAKCMKMTRELDVGYLDVVFMKSKYYQ